jgi:tetratricopeptide (TPR) repeat protein
LKVGAPRDLKLDDQDNRDGVVVALANKSLALYKLGNVGEAIDHAERALDIFEEIGLLLDAKLLGLLNQWREQATKTEAA